LAPLVTAEGGQPGQPAAAVGAAEAADRDREAIQDRDLRIEAELAEQLLAELSLERAQVGRLAGEGRGVDAAQAGSQSPQERRKHSNRPLSVLMPQNSPTHSMVRTSLSARIGLGPCWRSRRPPSHSSTRQYTVSTRQYTVMSSVVASKASADEPL
jgi:hypothetical protein